MPAPPVQPIVIWFGRVGDLILLSALLEILHRRFGSPCHVIGAGAWPAEIYAAHSDVARVSCLHRYTAWVLDPAWWRTRRALRAASYGVHRGARRVRRVARAARLARPHPDTGAAREPAHHAWPAAARLTRGRQGVAARTLGGAAAPDPRAAAAGTHPGVRRAARVTAARVDRRGGAAAGGGGGGAAGAAPAGPVCAPAQHDLRRHGTCACGGGAWPAAGGAVRRALTAPVAGARPLRLAGAGRRRTAAVHSPRSGFGGDGVRGVVCAGRGRGRGRPAPGRRGGPRQERTSG